MTTAVQQLTTTLGNLGLQMRQMHSSIEELQGQGQKEPRKTKELDKSDRNKMDVPGKTPGGPFYAVARGREGHQGIYQSWSECAGWVSGVPGNVFQKVGTLEAAHEFVEQYNAGQMSQRGEPQGGNLFREVERNAEIHPGGNEMGQGQRALAEHFKESRTKPHARPDLKYLGPDPSTKTEEEFYGIDATAELDLVKAMLPGGLEHGLKKGICQAITDVVALPGGYQTNAFDGEEGLALFTQSMAEMAHGGKSESKIFGKPDFNWRASGRTGLKTIRIFRTSKLVG
jgi:hypothetical protein